MLFIVQEKFRKLLHRARLAVLSGGPFGWSTQSVAQPPETRNSPHFGSSFTACCMATALILGSFHAAPQRSGRPWGGRSVRSVATPRQQARPQLVRGIEPEIVWADYPHIEPGEYPAISKLARTYFDRYFKRHICCVWFLVAVGPRRVKLPYFLNLGTGDQPRAGRRGNYWLAWIQANDGRLPSRGDRLSPRIFEQRAARVLVADTKMNFRGDGNFQPYSVIKNVLSWETTK